MISRAAPQSEKNEYLIAWRRARLDSAIQHLGGCCVVCGTVDDLEFDHIDRSIKVAEVSVLAMGTAAKFWEEVKKCQLLCRTHHRDKTAQERIAAHGSWRRYQKYKCRCDKCVAKSKEINKRTVENRRLKRKGVST